MKKLLCIGVFAFLSSFVFAQNRSIRMLKQIDDKINKIITQHTDNGKIPPTRSRVTQLNGKLKELIKELKEFRKNSNLNPIEIQGDGIKRKKYEYVLKYIGSKVMIYFLQTQRIIRYKDLSWENKNAGGNIDAFQLTFIDDYVKSYLFDQDTLKAEERVSFEIEAFKGLLNDESEYVFKRAYQENQKLLEVIHEQEKNIYDILTKEKKTFKQYKYVFENYSKNYLAYKAFKNYYFLYTSDGDAMTHKDFENKYGKYENLLLRLKTDTLDNGEHFFKQDQILARQGIDILESNNLKKIKEYLLNVHPKETAFLALQKIIALDIQNGKYCEARNKVLDYSELFNKDNPLYDTKRKYHNLLITLNNIILADDKKKLQRLENVITDDDDTRFIFSPNSKKMLVRGNGVGNTKAIEYRRAGNEWIYKEEHQGTQNSPIYRYAATNERLYEDKNKYITNERSPHSIEEDLILDIQIYELSGYEIMFFVSRNSSNRTETESNSIEYNSPWNVNRSNDEEFKCRDVGNRGIPFHGHRNGNTNTDIYYSIKKRGSAWGEPKNIGNLINTGFSERTPVLSSDAKYLYFSSEGHGGLGGLDIYKINIDLNLDNFKIDIPKDVVIENLVDFNTIKDDLNFHFFKDWGEVYFSSNRDDDIFKSGFDIYYWNEKDVERNDLSTGFHSFNTMMNSDTTIQFTLGISSCIDLKREDITVRMNNVALDTFYFDEYSNRISANLLITKLEGNEVRVVVRQNEDEPAIFVHKIDNPTPSSDGRTGKRTIKDKTNTPSSDGRTDKPTIKDKTNTLSSDGRTDKPTIKDKTNIPSSDGRTDKPTIKDKTNIPSSDRRTNKPLKIKPTIDVISVEDVTQNPQTTLLAYIKNAKKEDITIRHNDELITNFTLDENGLLKITVANLSPEENKIEIIAENGVGVETKEVKVFKGDPSKRIPIIKVIRPIENIHPDSNINVAAKIYNVDSDRDIKFFLNGKEHKFSFDPNDKWLNTHITLTDAQKSKGSNAFDNFIEISAMNTYGKDTVWMQLIFLRLLPEEIRKRKDNGIRTIQLSKHKQNKSNSKQIKVTVQGTATDDKSKNPIDGAKIEFDNNIDDVKTVNTDSKGQFTIDLLKEKYKMMLSAQNGEDYYFMDGKLVDLTEVVGNLVFIVDVQATSTVNSSIASSHVFFFDVDKTIINNKKKIEEHYRKSLPEWKDNVDMIRIVGFADTTGSTCYNCDLSKRRAESVKDFFVSALGWDENKIETLGAGETTDFDDNFIRDLIADDVWERIKNDDKEIKKQLNRRVYILIESEFKPATIRKCREEGCK